MCWSQLLCYGCGGEHVRDVRDAAGALDYFWLTLAGRCVGLLPARAPHLCGCEWFARTAT